MVKQDSLLLLTHLCDTRSLVEMVKQDCLLVLTLCVDTRSLVVMEKQNSLLVRTLLGFQIIGCDGEARLSARADPCVISDH